MKDRITGALLVLALCGLGCQDACNGCGSAIGKEAAEKITDSVDNLVDQLPDIIQKIDDMIAANIGAIDTALAHQIQEINRLLKENISGINAALQATIDNVDAMLAARLDQIFKFATGFLKELDDLFARRINQLSFTLEKLIRSLEISGSELLETAGFQVVRTIREGNQVVAVVIGGAIEMVVIVTAAIVMVLVVVLAGIFYIRQRKLARGDRPRLVGWQLGLGAGFFGLVFGVGALMLFVPSVRASVASGRVALSEEGVCAEVVPLAAAFVADHRAAKPGDLGAEKNQEGTKLLGGLYQCMAEGSVADLRQKTREYAATIERLIGADTRCRRNEECVSETGTHCQVTTGLCTTRCEGPQHCAAGQVCHSPETIGICGAQCSAANPCSAGLTCTRAQCEPELPAQPKPGTGVKPRFVRGGIIKDLVIRPATGCPGPRCPIVVCKTGCGVVDPHDVRPRRIFVTPEGMKDLETVKEHRIKHLDRYFDPRLRGSDL